MKTTRQLWEDYLFLTREMLKFIDQEELELFYELLDQRERLQTELDGRQIDFLPPARAKQMVFAIQQDNQRIMGQLRTLLNKTKSNHNRSRSYDGLGVTVSGIRFDRKS
ncbi:hypothetical protein [Sporomusa termitida]|uniref:Flagellar protein FliT n=1 Tax=Sporomusa termitida TaxID=2377 RepID=A0A517DX59_9FIRM|nr:hypothetical protein [Sporomusa termitida]QDR81940.1 hypothetical protein SPTER_33600 [Sporomusa termitida]